VKLTLTKIPQIKDKQVDVVLLLKTRHCADMYGLIKNFAAILIMYFVIL